MRDYFVGILMLLVAIFLGAGGYFVYTQVNDEGILIVLSDDTECEAIGYSIVLKEKTILVGASQMNSYKYEGGVSNEVFISFLGNADEEGLVNYRVEAAYEDCPAIEGPLNRVQPGWVIYESIKDGKVHHDVRAK